MCESKWNLRLNMGKNLKIHHNFVLSILYTLHFTQWIINFDKFSHRFFLNRINWTESQKFLPLLSFTFCVPYFAVECRLGWFGWRISRSNDTTKKICARHHFDTGRPWNGSERLQTNLCNHFEIGFGAMDGWMCFVCCSIPLFAWFTMDVGFCVGRNYRSRITSRRCTVPISTTYQRLWRGKRHPNIDCKLYLFVCFA